MQTLSPAEMAKLFGCPVSEIHSACGELLQRVDLSYRLAEGAERDALLLDIVKRIDSHSLRVAGEGRQDEWERGWGENLKELIETNFDVKALVPKYIRPGEPVRLFRQLAIPAPRFIQDYTMVFRAWAFRKFLSEARTIYDFGCGPGSHLAYLASIFPNKRLVGLDWADASAKILKALASHYGWPIEGRRFDFFNPDPTLVFESGVAVMTYGALEQIGNRYEPFLNYLVDHKPVLCLHIEPLAELYDDTNLLDYFALRYHHQRKYLDGFLTTLRSLEASGKITIDAIHRHQFGTKFAETYSYVAWRPNC